MNIAFYTAPFVNIDLERTFQRAAARATSLEQPIIASFTQPISYSDPIHLFKVFQLLNLGDSFFWAHPVSPRALVGTGIATAITTSGPDCISAAAMAWRDLQQDAVIGQTGQALPAHTSGPILFGGFAFDPANPRTSLWQDFPDGLLILPCLLYHCDETNVALTINRMIQPNEDIQSIIDEVQNILHLFDVRVNDCLRIGSAHSDKSGHSTDCSEISNILAFDDRNFCKDDFIRHLLSPTLWMEQVANAITMIHEERLQKVVLARAIQVACEEEVVTILGRLSANYPTAYIFALQRGERYFVGATPERLICGVDGQIHTVALAGSAPRGRTEEEDTHLGNELLHSAKNLGEHQVVVTTIQQALATICSHVWISDTPHLLKLKNIQHLETPIAGHLLPGHSILEAVAYLHPTPAVGGFPRQAALETIRASEQLDRGWYAGPIGWIGASGNGEFAVALRSGLIDRHQATLFAGCGIVADSQPEHEFAESCLKLEVMLQAINSPAFTRS